MRFDCRQIFLLLRCSLSSCFFIFYLTNICRPETEEKKNDNLNVPKRCISSTSDIFHNFFFFVSPRFVCSLTRRRCRRVFLTIYGCRRCPLNFIIFHHLFERRRNDRKKSLSSSSTCNYQIFKAFFSLRFLSTKRQSIDELYFDVFHQRFFFLFFFISFNRTYLFSIKSLSLAMTFHRFRSTENSLCFDLLFLLISFHWCLMTLSVFFIRTKEEIFNRRISNWTETKRLNCVSLRSIDERSHAMTATKKTSCATLNSHWTNRWRRRRQRWSTEKYEDEKQAIKLRLMTNSDYDFIVVDCVDFCWFRQCIAAVVAHRRTINRHIVVIIFLWKKKKMWNLLLSCRRSSHFKAMQKLSNMTFLLIKCEKRRGCVEKYFHFFPFVWCVCVCVCGFIGDKKIWNFQKKKKKQKHFSDCFVYFCYGGVTTKSTIICYGSFSLQKWLFPSSSSVIRIRSARSLINKNFQAKQKIDFCKKFLFRS